MEIDTLKVMNSSLGLIGSGIGAYTNLSPIEDIEQYNSQAQQLGNSNYQLGSLLSLADLYAQRNIPQSITGETLYNPSAEERFGQLFSSGMSGFQAGYNFADNFTDNMGTTFILGGSGYNTASGKGWGDLGNAIEELASQGKDFSGTGGINMLMKEFNVKGAKYALGGLMLDNGSMINAAAGLGMAGINMGLNAAGNARRRRQAEQDALRYNALRDFAINRNTLDFQRAINDSTDNMFNMAALQMKASGGPLFTNGGIWSNGLTSINNGGTHEQNPFEGVPMGIAPDGIPNLVEENETVWTDDEENSYVFSERLKVSKKMLDKHMLPSKYEGKSYAEVSKELAKEAEERPNDPISKKGLEDSMTKLQLAQEEYKAEKDRNRLNTFFKNGGMLGHKFFKGGDKDPFLETGLDLAHAAVQAELEQIRLNAALEVARILLREFDILSGKEKVKLGPSLLVKDITSGGVSDSQISSYKKSKENENNKQPKDLDSFNFSPNSLLRYTPTLIQGIQALKGNKVDYTNPNLIAANTRNINFTPLGDYIALERLPFVSTVGNKMQAQLAATNAAIQNVAANRAAAIPSLITSGYKGQTALADAALEAAKYNNLLTQTESEFNRGTNQANLTAGLQTARANQQLAYESAVLQAAMREAIDLYISASDSANVSNFMESLLNIGRENLDRKALLELIADGIFGSMSDKQKTALSRGNAYGGKLKRNKRKGLTC